MQSGTKLMSIENGSSYDGSNTSWKMYPKAELNLNLGSIFPQSVTKLATFFVV